MAPISGGATNEEVDTTEEIKHVALNGAQVTAMIGVIQSYKTGVLSRSQAVNILVASFGFTHEDAERMCGEGDIDVNDGHGAQADG